MNLGKGGSPQYIYSSSVAVNSLSPSGYGASPSANNNSGIGAAGSQGVIILEFY